MKQTDDLWVQFSVEMLAFHGGQYLVGLSDFDLVFV